MGISDFRVERQDLSAGDLELEARENESLSIVARGVAGVGAGEAIEEYVREELMLGYPGSEAFGKLLQATHVENLHTDLLKYMKESGMRAPSIKVPEGQTYILSNPDGSGEAVAIYRELDANGVSRSAPGGPDTKTRTFISSGQITANVEAGGSATATVEESINPPQLPDFPFEEDVRANYEYDLQGLALAIDGSSAADTSIGGFRLTSDETDFLARDSAFVDPALTSFPNGELTVLPMMFPSNPTFSPGAELELTLDLANGGGAAADVIANASYIFYRRSV